VLGWSDQGSTLGQKQTFRSNLDVSFGSQADFRNAISMSALGQKQPCAPQKVMSALAPKADTCDATRDVRFGPKADISRYSITSSARDSSDDGIMIPSAFAVLLLMTNSNRVACRNGKSVGRAPFRICTTCSAAFM
jgi:hypothetical protein